MRRCPHNVYINIPCPACKTEHIEARLQVLELHLFSVQKMPSLWQKFKNLWNGDGW